MTLLTIDKPGTYNLGVMTGGLVALNDNVVRVTAPDVIIQGLDGRAMTRAKDAASMNEGHNWPAFVYVAPSAVRCKIVESQLNDVDGIGIDVRADDCLIDKVKVTHMAAGVRVESCNRSLIRNSALHLCDKMLRVGPSGNDDTGAEIVIHANTPRVAAGAVRHVVQNSFLGNAEAPSPDYAYDGAGWEVWQASSVEWLDCVLTDCNNCLETGSHGPQVADLHMLRCYLGAFEIVNDEHYRRGLMWRPVVDSSVRDCKFFDLDHWNVALNQGSATYAAGVTSNFQWSGNQHACTRNSKAYSGTTTGVSIDTASETILYGAAAAALDAKLKGEAITRRDMILAGAGLAVVKPPIPIPPTDDLAALTARVAALEAGLKAEQAARASADTAEQQARAAADAALDTRLDDIGASAAG